MEKALATHSSTLAWKIPWQEEPGRLQSMGSLRVGHDWVTSLSLFTFMHWRRKWQPTPVFLPGESQGRGSLVGCCLWGRTELDTTEATQQQQLSQCPVFLQEYQKVYEFWFHLGAFIYWIWIWEVWVLEGYLSRVRENWYTRSTKSGVDNFPSILVLFTRREKSLFRSLINRELKAT